MNNLIEKMENHNIIYISVNPERALGLEKILPNFYIVSLLDSYIFNFLNKDKFYSLKKESPNIDINENSKELLLQDGVRNYINQFKNPSFMFFKITSGIELILEKHKILNSTSYLNKLYENKINIVEYFKDMIPKSIPYIPGNTTYNDLKKNIGDKFVIQFIHGHSGESTFFINNKDEFDQIKNKYPERFSKAVRFVEGDTYTINGIVTKKGIYVFNLSKQITGIQSLTQYIGGTVGNDWLVQLPEKIRLDLLNRMNSIGERLEKNGYKGLFGADFIYDGSNIYLLDLNPRENASVPTFTKIQIKNKIVPAKLIHILEFLNIEYEIDIESYNQQIFNDLNLRQIIIRNTKDSVIKMEGDINGIYDNNLKKIREEYDIGNIDNNEFLILSTKGDIDTNMEIARIQTKNHIKKSKIDQILEIIN